MRRPAIFCVRVLLSVDLYLLTDKLGEYPHRLGKALARPVHEADITVEGVLSEIERSHTCGPAGVILQGCLNHHGLRIDRCIWQPIVSSWRR
ncbi:hypothetical protein EMIT0194P_310039 [Pseudomonas serbica]